MIELAHLWKPAKSSQFRVVTLSGLYGAAVPCGAGRFMQTLPIIFVIIVIVATVMIALGFDSIWLGILIVKAALITSPVGMNFVVMHSIRKSGFINVVIEGSLPFAAALFVVVALVAVFPDIALGQPRLWLTPARSSFTLSLQVSHEAFFPA